MTLTELFERRVLVCVGPGGVGKTTVAAALALAAAESRRVALITVDPAQRLADVLGLGGLDDALRPVTIGSRQRTLSAAMLDTGDSYDALIRRIATPERAAEILHNRVYRAFSRTLARSHAYIATERLYDMLSEDYDLIVLDTPPLRSALEILDASSHLVDFLDDGVLQWFLNESTTRRAATMTGAAALALLERLTGATLVRELTGFLRLFAELREGFRERSLRVQEVLQAPDSGFLLVTSSSAESAEAAAGLREELEARSYAIEAVIVNRAYHEEPEAPLVPVIRPSAPSIPDGRARDDASLPTRVAALRARLSEENRAGQTALEAAGLRPSEAYLLPVLPQTLGTGAQLERLVDAIVQKMPGYQTGLSDVPVPGDGRPPDLD
ncbi:MAG: ArsA-related P-loop ATPase [Myxococcota bacterium]